MRRITSSMRSWSASAGPRRSDAPSKSASTGGRPSGRADQRGAHPVVRPGAAGPQPGGEAILLGLGCLVGVRRAPAQAVPGAVEHLVVARGGGAVGGQVLPAGLALD